MGPQPYLFTTHFTVTLCGIVMKFSVFVAATFTIVCYGAAVDHSLPSLAPTQKEPIAKSQGIEDGQPYPPPWKRVVAIEDGQPYPPPWKRDIAVEAGQPYPPPWKRDVAVGQGQPYPPPWKRASDSEAGQPYPPPWKRDAQGSESEDITVP